MLCSFYHNCSWICLEGALHVIFINLFSVRGTCVLWYSYFSAKFRTYQQQSTRKQQNINELKCNSGFELFATVALITHLLFNFLLLMETVTPNVTSQCWTAGGQRGDSGRTDVTVRQFTEQRRIRKRSCSSRL